VFKVRIITPQKRAFDGEATFVEFRTVEGAMGTLQKRAPLLGALAISELEIENAEGKREIFAIHGGIAEFSENTFTILSDAAERADEIDVERAKRALEKAKMELENVQDEKSKKDLEGKIQRAMVRLKVANRK
jgi:F-type H+-transporting ATPase subunit epsilon